MSYLSFTLLTINMMIGLIMDVINFIDILKKR